MVKNQVFTAYEPYNKRKSRQFRLAGFSCLMDADTAGFWVMSRDCLNNAEIVTRKKARTNFRVKCLTSGPLVVCLTFFGSDKGQNYPTQEPKNCDHKQQNRHGHGKRCKQHTGFDRFSILEYYDDEQSCSYGYGHPFQFLHG